MTRFSGQNAGDTDNDTGFDTDYDDELEFEGELDEDEITESDEDEDELDIDALLGPDEDDLDAPQPEKKPAQKAKKAAPDPIDIKFDAVLEKLNQNLSARPAQQEQPRQAQVQVQWVDPFERPENKAALAALEDEAFIDPAKMKELRVLERKLMKEQSDHELEVRMSQINAQTQAVVSAPKAREAAFKAIKTANPSITREAYDAAITEFTDDALDGNEGLLGQLLTNPDAREKTLRLLSRLTVAQTVELRQKAKPAAQRTTTVQPKRKAAPSVPARQARNEVLDTKHLDELAYGSRGRRQYLNAYLKGGK